MSHSSRAKVNSVNRNIPLVRGKLPKMAAFEDYQVALDPMEAWMERQLRQSRLTAEQVADTHGNEPLQSNWALLAEAMQLYCTSVVRPTDPYGRHSALSVNYFTNLVGGSDALPYWEEQ